VHTSRIITLEPCACKAEFEHFTLRDLIKFTYFVDTTEREERGESRPKDRVKTG
jgi:hypothetical protein